MNLKEFSQQSNISLSTFFVISRQLTNIVLELHRQNKIVKVINPHTIMMDEKTNEIKLVDFSFAEGLNENHYSIVDIVDSHSIPYISPEIIGRNSNVEIDFRTDIYSLGVIFYELLTKKLPINAKDPSEWIHYQNAQKVLLLHQVNNEIPIVLSNIVMKCLERNLSKRYQSITGLFNDIENCRIQWESKEKIEAFPLGEVDISPIIKIPNKLYGREQEYTLLNEQWNRVSLEKTSGALFISGPAGVGKTRLIEEIKELVKKSKGYYIYGKFDQNNTEIPYSTFIQAFEQLITYILAEDEQIIHAWRTELIKVLNNNSFVIAEFIPKLQLIIGEQKTETQIPPTELEVRFKIAIGDFIRLAAKLSDPLVIVLDDLHWADDASLKLLDYLLKENIDSLMLIGAYRNYLLDETKKGTFKEKLLEGKKDLNITNISLSSFTVENIHDLIFDIIGEKENELLILAKHLREKTNGNAFFVQEMIKEIFEQKLIKYNLEIGTWEISIEEIKALDFSENVIVFLIKKMKQMSNQSQILIQYAACVGNTFKIDLLSKLIKNKVNDIGYLLWEITQLGLIKKIDSNSYKFVHDKIQQAAYSLMDAERKKVTHYQIGKLMLINFINSTDFNDKLYEIVGQLNEGIELLKKEEEAGLEIAKLNLQAAKKAMGTTAFISALSFFQYGVELLDKDSWKKDYPLTFQLYFGCLECSYLTNKFTLAEKYFDQIISHVQHNEHRLKVLLIKLMLYTKLDKADEVIDLGLAILKENGISARKNPSKLQIVLERRRVFSYLKKFGETSLVKKPEETNSSKALLLDIVLYMGPSLHVLNPELLALLALKLSNYSLKNRNFENSCSIYAGYSIVEIAHFNRNKGFELGKYAVKLAEDVGSINDKCIVNFIFGAFISHWLQHAKKSNDYLMKSIEYSFISGNLLYGGFAIAHYIISLHIRGKSLAELRDNIQKFDKYKNKIKDIHYIQLLKTYDQYILALEGKTKDRFTFSDESFDESIFLAELNEAGMRKRKLFDYYLCKAQIYYLLGNYQEGIQFSREAEKHTNSFLGIISIPEYTFYYSLLITNGWAQFSLEERKYYKTKLKKNIKKLKDYADDCPENFLDKYLITKGELARISKNYDHALRYYNQAIEAANANEFLQNEAIGNELASRLYFDLGMNELGKMHLVSAYDKFKRMGYQTKINQLQKLFPFLQKSTVDKLFVQNDKELKINRILDTSAIIKATQALSGEIVLEELLKKLMSIVLQYACANRGVLLLINDDHLVVEVEGNLVGDETKTLLYNSLSIERYVNISHSIVKYVYRTNEAVLFEQGSDELVFLRDEYISTAKPNAILCIPISTHNKFIGIIYLENHVANESFCVDCMEVIQVLSTQFAISIENAHLYKTLQLLNLHLEEKVKERTEHLQKTHIAMAEALAEKAKLEERNRIAREIHDTVGHTLTTILVQIEAGKRLIHKDSQQALKNLELSQEQVRSGLNDIRQSLRMLKSGNESNQLIPPIQSFIEEINENTNIKIKYDIAKINLTSEQNYVLYRVLQEGITNGIRHGEATQFYCQLVFIDERINFSLEDNGKGSLHVVYGMGLSAMKERVEALNGTFLIETEQEKGFKIKIIIPM